MKKYEYVLYNNYDYSENYTAAREWLFASHQDDFDWETEDDIPEKMVLEEMSFLEESEWAYFKEKCEVLLKNGVCLLTGVCGRWNGPAHGGKFIRSFHDFVGCISHLDYLKIIDRNGHLLIEGCHHDGSDRYELKQLTRRGQEDAQQYNYARNEQLHNTIMHCNLFSRLPRLASI